MEVIAMIMLPMLLLLTVLLLVGFTQFSKAHWQEMHKLRTDLAAVRSHLDRQAKEDAELEAQIGRTWIPEDQDVRATEQILKQQGKARAHARTGSDPFTNNARLAP